LGTVPETAVRFRLRPPTAFETFARFFTAATFAAGKVSSELM
jgi:hypothetical protein